MSARRLPAIASRLDAASPRTANAAAGRWPRGDWAGTGASVISRDADRCVDEAAIAPFSVRTATRGSTSLQADDGRSSAQGGDPRGLGLVRLGQLAKLGQRPAENPRDLHLR